MSGIIVPYTKGQVKQASEEACKQLKMQLPTGLECIVLIFDRSGNKFHWTTTLPADVVEATFLACARNPHGRPVQ